MRAFNSNREAEELARAFMEQGIPIVGLTVLTLVAIVCPLPAAGKRRTRANYGHTEPVRCRGPRGLERGHCDIGGI
jgi:hypothetical protein